MCQGPKKKKKNLTNCVMCCYVLFHWHHLFSHRHSVLRQCQQNKQCRTIIVRRTFIHRFLPNLACNSHCLQHHGAILHSFQLMAQDHSKENSQLRNYLKLQLFLKENISIQCFQPNLNLLRPVKSTFHQYRQYS